MVILQVNWGRVEVLWKLAYKRLIFSIKTDKNCRTAGLQVADFMRGFRVFFCCGRA